MRPSTSENVMIFPTHGYFTTFVAHENTCVVYDDKPLFRHEIVADWTELLFGFERTLQRHA